MPDEAPGEPKRGDTVAAASRQQATLGRALKGHVEQSFTIENLLRNLYAEGYRDGYKAAKEEANNAR